MHVASGDRFVSFKAGGDRRDDSFFFYRAGYRMAGREERPKKKVAPKNSLTFGAEEVYANVSSQLEVVMNTTILSYYMLIEARRNVGELTYIQMVGIFV